MTPVNYKIVGKRIREIRRKKHLSQADIATATEMSEAYISYVENATKKASIESLVKIADALGVTVNDLLAGNQEHDNNIYKNDIADIMNDCSEFEKRIIVDTITSLKYSIRDNVKDLVKADSMRKL